MIAASSSPAMAVSCSVASPLPSCSSVSSPTLRILYCPARIHIATSFSKKNNWGLVYCSVTSQLVVASSRPPARIGRAGRNGDMEFCVVTFYKFVSIENPEGEVVKHQEFLQGRDIHGRIYVNEQGINAQADSGDLAEEAGEGQKITFGTRELQLLLLPKCRNFRSRGREVVEGCRAATEGGEGSRTATSEEAKEGGGVGGALRQASSRLASDRTGKERRRLSEVEQRQGRRRGRSRMSAKERRRRRRAREARGRRKVIFAASDSRCWPDQNVVTADLTGRECRRRSYAEQRRRSRQAPVVASDQAAVTSDPDWKGKPSNERSRAATGEPRVIELSCKQYSGPIEDALAYADWLKEDARFSDILVQTSPALDGHAFPRLKMRYKPSLVQASYNLLFEGGMSHLPVLNPTMRATLLTPAEWRERLQASINPFELPNKASGSNHDRRLLLLDVRNGYEWDVGHFQGAERPEVDSFRHTSVGLASEETVAFDLLAGVDKENTDILMYCTGGIRCDVYSTVLRQRGFQNLYTLNGGVSHYLKSEGSTGWVGNLFVFDSRLSLPPSTYNSNLTTNVRSKIVSESERFAKCYICRSQVLEFRHRNCANLDCNRLFLSCGSCVEEFRGCCCSDCTQARRLRPVLPGYKRYEKWHQYRDDF
ncbi:hypothetical protein M5K25_001398 [Dendrobium thyrsiflorum]|uniref:Rhodanese domain-containing protein n=1 Tax=Dendrobium thyrsiflorum TaxID=117978 RepID=A0ABD0VQ98_DENTH